MPTYQVQWSIGITAETPMLAAKVARRIQLDPENTADHFEVIAEDGTTFDVNAEDE